MKPFLPFLIALCSCIMVSACKPSGEEQVNEVIVKLDQAFLAYKGGEYDQFYALMSETNSILVYLEPFKGVPDFSTYTIGNNLCDLGAIKDYHSSLSHILKDMIWVMQGKQLTSGERSLIARTLKDIASAVKRNAPLASQSDIAQRRDCDQYFPGYSERVRAVEEYAKGSLHLWLGLYEETYGRSAVQDAQGFTRARQIMDLNNWNTLSESEKHYFTLGDPEVEKCLSAFIGNKAPSAEVANTDDVARLCRQGLD